MTVNHTAYWSPAILPEQLSQYLSKTFYQHKRLLYDCRLKKWYPYRVVDRDSFLETPFVLISNSEQEDSEIKHAHN